MKDIIKNKTRLLNMRKRLFIDLKYLANFYKPRIIEFGSGLGVYAKILEAYGYSVYTTDINPDFKPKKVIDITKDLDFFEKERTEMIICHHVLEHVTKSKAIDCLMEFARILRVNGVLSLALPRRRYWIKLGLRLPSIIDKEINIYKDKPKPKDTYHMFEITSDKDVEDWKEFLEFGFNKVKLYHNDLESYFIAIK